MVRTAALAAVQRSERPPGEGVSWASLIAVVLFSWPAVALAVGPLVGPGIAFGAGSDCR